MDKEKTENGVAVYVLAGVLFCALVLCGFWFMRETEEEAERVVAKRYENAPKVGEFCEISGMKWLFLTEEDLREVVWAGDVVPVLKAQRAEGRAWNVKPGARYKVLRINKKNMSVKLKGPGGQIGWTKLDQCTRVDG